MKEKNVKHYIDGPLTILVFGIFAACIVLTLFAGAGVYKRINQRDAQNYFDRTCLQYIATKLRSAADPQAIRVVDFGDGTALEMSENINGREFVTKIYSHEGMLMELYTLQGVKAGPEAGEKLMDIAGVDFSLDNTLLQVTIRSADGESRTQFLSIRGGEKGAA